jgi:hypothetical protein
MSSRNDPETPSPSDLDEAYTKVLGYLNFSNGKSDVDFLGQLNRLAIHCDVESSWEPLRTALAERLEKLAGSSPAFSDAAQASAALAITIDSRSPMRTCCFTLSRPTSPIHCFWDAASKPYWSKAGHGKKSSVSSPGLLIG